MNFIENFPLPSIRDGQRHILETLANNWDNHRVFIVEAATGVGKSAVSYALTETLGGMILTDTKALQDQYHAEFEGIGDLRGKSNFSCNKFPHMTAEEAPCNAHGRLIAACLNSSSGCDYYENQAKAYAARSIVANYAMFFGLLQGSIQTGKQFVLYKDVVVCDEGHLLDGKLADLASFELSMESLSNWFGIDIPSELEEVLLTGDGDVLRMTFGEVLCEMLTERINELSSELSDLGNTLQSGSADPKTMKRNKRVLGMVRSLTTLRTQLETYVRFPDDDWFLHQNAKDRKVRIAPMHAKRFFWSYMGKAANKIVIMSASLGDTDTFMNELGVAKNEAMVIKVGSPFDPSKSPVVMIPMLQLDYKNLDANLPLLLDIVDSILDDHAQDKGIIHVNSYKVANYVLTKSRHKERLIGKPDGDDRTNQELVVEHQLSPYPTVLISPSMHTGIDLKGDLSRFQIIPKMPFASLGDPYIRAKNDRNSYWYLNDVWKKLIQASGRSTRTEKDEAVTYVLDIAVKRSYKQFQKSLPDWFTSRVVWM